MPVLKLKHHSNLYHDYDFLFFHKGPYSLKIRLSGRPVAFKWEERCQGNPVRRGLYVGSPTCLITSNMRLGSQAAICATSQSLRNFQTFAI